MRICKIQEERESMREAMEKFIRLKEAQGVAARTMRDYKRFLPDFLANSRESFDEAILKQDILNYFSAIPDTSPARYNHPYQNLSSFFNWCITQDYIAKNPITSLGLHKKKDDGNIKPASIEDVKILLKSWDQSSFAGFRNYVITLVMLDTGIRTSELIRLRDVDYDPTAKQILVSKHISKTRKNRTVYLSNSTSSLLDKFLRIKPKGWTEWMFPTREGGQMRTEGLDLEFNRQCKKIGVKMTPYQFRHTFASYFVASGGDIFTLQDLMGHSDIRMTRRYTELDDANKKKQHRAYSPVNALQGASRLVKL
jgi:site-specific recombinase XerD